MTRPPDGALQTHYRRAIIRPRGGTGSQGSQESPVRGHLRSAEAKTRPPEVKAMEEDLQRALSRKVELHLAGRLQKRGRLSWNFIRWMTSITSSHN